MSTTEPTPPPPPPAPSFSLIRIGPLPPSFRLIPLLCVVAFALLIGLIIVNALVRGRAGMADQAASSVAASWGPDQHLTGPYLVIPGECFREVRDNQGRVQVISEPVEWRALPATLDVDVHLPFEVRKRGIFATAIFTADVRLAATFDGPALAALLPTAPEVVWYPDRAWLEIELTDSRGLLPGPSARWDGKPLAFTAGPASAGTSPTLRLTGTSLSAGGRLEAAFQVATTGGWHVLPAGASTTLRMNSPWPDPSFVGVRLPSQREVVPDGFTAVWKTGEWTRGIPSHWTTLPNLEIPAPKQDTLKSSQIGVQLKPSLDLYRLIGRATEYGVLFLAVGLGAMWITDLRSRHPLPGMAIPCTGAALVLFFLTLLAAAEHLSFGLAYALATALELAVLGGYLWSLGQGWRLVAGVLGPITLAHGYLYFVLRLEDHALIAGTAVFWILLIALMAVSQNRKK